MQVPMDTPEERAATPPDVPRTAQQPTQARLAAAEARMRVIAAENVALQQQLLATEQRLATAEQALEAVLTSTTWRMFAPLRGIIERVRPATGQLRRRFGPPPVAAPEGEISTLSEPVLILPFRIAGGIAPPRWRIAVLLHAFHVDQAAEFRHRLAAIPGAFDLYVSTDTEAKAQLLREAFAGGPAARLEVRVMPNRGRDIAPKLLGFADVHRDHDLVLHLHTKASSHNATLAAWRDWLLDSLLGSQPAVASILEAFARLPQLGIVAPRNFPFTRPHMGWGPNFAISRELAARLDLDLTPDSPLDFPAGSMFWARSAALVPLLDAGLTLADFPAEAWQTDGTIAHAVERLYFYSCEKAGLRWAHAGPDRAIAVPEWALRIDSQAALEQVVSDQMPALLLPGLHPRPTEVPNVPPADPTDIRQRFRAFCADRLDAFLAGDERLVFPSCPQPKTSVILVLFNQAELTFHCLESLRRQAEAGIEVIILDNGSTDLTGALLDRLHGVHVIRSPENLHFLRGVNRAAQDAKGEYLLLLNNDTRVAPGAITAAADRLDAEADLGAVGGPIVLLDGSLQEAGSIIFRDGSCLGYGRGRDPGEAEFQFRRDVDYCSGAFLMLRRALFDRLGGFDEAYAPAYYEETDLCMRLRAAGFRIGYEPRARIAHMEFGSATSSSSALELQRRNSEIFRQRHATALAADHLPPGTPPVIARLRPRPAGRVLIIDDRVPFPALGSGYPRAQQIIADLDAAGWSVTFYPLKEPAVSFEAAYAALPPSVEIAAGLAEPGLAAFLAARVGCYDAVLVSRPHNMAVYERACAEAPRFAAATPLIYDAEAIFAARDVVRAELTGDRAAAAVATRAVAAELALAGDAKVVLTVTEAEATKFRAAGQRDVRVLGHSMQTQAVGGGPQGRDGILFLGALDDDASPNADSLEWFVQEVMPRIDAAIGSDWQLTVVGRNAAARVLRLASTRVRLLGQVEDIDGFFASARLFVAPTRYAAGIPMKVHTAAGAGLPVVATELLREQLGWTDGQELLAASTAEGFAAACVKVWRDDALWLRLRDNALAAVARDCDTEQFRTTLADAVAYAAARPSML